MGHLHAKGTNLWRFPEHALAYLEQADSIPHRAEGEEALLECLSRPTTRFLDLGSGDGRLIGLVHLLHPGAQAVAIDFSDTMVDRLRRRFGENPLVTVLRHDLDEPLPTMRSAFDAVVSSFAIHHLVDARKERLYAEVFDCLTAGGVFCNLEHVASASPTLHAQFLERLGIPVDEEDPSNKLVDVETQLRWLRSIGFIDVDCLWKWRELALLAARKPAR
jgi:tRNA (cmo5U34)-methyltransferase